MILFPLMTTWMWFQIFKASPLLSFVPLVEDTQLSKPSVPFEGS